MKAKNPQEYESRVKIDALGRVTFLDTKIRRILDSLIKAGELNSDLPKEYETRILIEPTGRVTFLDTDVRTVIHELIDAGKAMEFVARHPANMSELEEGTENDGPPNDVDPPPDACCPCG